VIGITGAFMIHTDRWVPFPATMLLDIDNTDDDIRNISVALIGNSMFYFNDFPRLLEVISHGKISQNSCLHGGASIVNEGSGMYPQFMTNRSVLGTFEHAPLYDFGACTVPQLLVGYDERIHDPGYAMPDAFDLLVGNNSNPRRILNTYLEYTIETCSGDSPTPRKQVVGFHLDQ
jgi:hypothetical protein